MPKPKLTANRLRRTRPSHTSHTQAPSRILRRGELLETQDTSLLTVTAHSEHPAVLSSSSSYEDVVEPPLLPSKLTEERVKKTTSKSTSLGRKKPSVQHPLNHPLCTNNPSTTLAVVKDLPILHPLQAVSVDYVVEKKPSCKKDGKKKTVPPPPPLIEKALAKLPSFLPPPPSVTTPQVNNKNIATIPFPALPISPKLSGSSISSNGPRFTTASKAPPTSTRKSPISSSSPSVGGEYAGPMFSNSPAPSALPKPDFGERAESPFLNRPRRRSTTQSTAGLAEAAFWMECGGGSSGQSPMGTTNGNVTPIATTFTRDVSPIHTPLHFASRYTANAPMAIPMTEKAMPNRQGMLLPPPFVDNQNYLDGRRSEVAKRPGDEAYRGAEDALLFGLLFPPQQPPPPPPPPVPPQNNYLPRIYNKMDEDYLYPTRNMTAKRRDLTPVYNHSNNYNNYNNNVGNEYRYETNTTPVRYHDHEAWESRGIRNLLNY